MIFSYILEQSHNNASRRRAVEVRRCFAETQGELSAQLWVVGIGKSVSRTSRSKGGFEGGRWVVVDPKSDGFEVDVYFKTFPPGTSEEEMNAALAPINLAGMVNAPARLAMSYPGLRAADRAKLPDKPDRTPVVRNLEKLFRDYQPPKP
ncbi:MAG TPA: hypothetical protein PKD86_08920 [Gemmatales bacterium]|nr:hypothetical protein [Gemmatales bacterium]